MTNKNDLIGSPSRDDFKWRHKHRLAERCFAVDLDLAWVGKWHILAIFDYKHGDDGINYNEHVAYRSLLDHAPVIIVRERARDIFDVIVLYKSQLEAHKCGEFQIATAVGWSWLQELRDRLETAELTAGDDRLTYRALADEVLRNMRTI